MSRSEEEVVSASLSVCWLLLPMSGAYSFNISIASRRCTPFACWYRLALFMSLSLSRTVQIGRCTFTSLTAS
uniref:Putative secreted peptide n=1 Tax=Anopheles braziliensis TaxID=58242 RepID=A0A2M3ZPS3_9DIPT